MDLGGAMDWNDDDLGGGFVPGTNLDGAVSDPSQEREG
jgi:hypothetical protein